MLFCYILHQEVGDRSLRFCSHFNLEMSVGVGEIGEGSQKVQTSRSKIDKSWDFPGDPVVKTPRFHCRGHGFDPWSGN